MLSIFRDHLLQDKTAVITGGGSGIGQRIAERFAEHGAKVVLAGRKQDKLDAAAARIKESGGHVETAALDVRDYPALEALFQKIAPVDILVCAAAGNFPAPIAAMSANGFKAVIDIDLLGTFNACRASYPHLRKPGAAIIAISANQATQPFALQAHVCAGKAGVELMIKTLAIEWGPEGVRANIITPGPTGDTEGMRRLAPSPEALERSIRSVPLGRLGTKDELADLALYLCSSAAGYITGATFVCDGGSGLSHSGSLSAAAS